MSDPFDRFGVSRTIDVTPSRFPSFGEGKVLRAGGTYLLWRGAYVRERTERTAQAALRDFGERLLDKANEHVPFDIGTLKDSGKVTVLQARTATGQFTSGAEVAVSYDTPYAVRLHEHPEYNFQPPGEGKWLAKAMQRLYPAMPRLLAPKFLALYREP